RAPSADEGGGEGGDHAESAPEHAVVHGRLDADVTDAPGAICEHLGLLFGTSEELDEKGTGHVEPVGHGLAHGGVELVPLPGHGGELRSEEHTSELQSRENLVCRLLLEKKK